MSITVDVNGTHYALRVCEHLIITPPESYAAMDAVGMMADLPAYACNEGDTSGVYTADDGAIYQWSICINGKPATHLQIINTIEETQ